MWPNVWRGQHLIIDKASCWRNVIRCLPFQMTDNNTQNGRLREDDGWVIVQSRIEEETILTIIRI